MKIQTIYDFLDYLAPFSTQEEWDNCGLAVGSLTDEVETVMVALDITHEVLLQAEKAGAQLIITHHPLLFHPAASVAGDSLLYRAIHSGIALLSSHTCLDKAEFGVNACLAKKAGIEKVRRSSLDPFLFIGEVPAQSAEAFAAHLSRCLGGAVRYCTGNSEIRTVGFCSGAGADLWAQAKAEGADAFLTGDASHHDFLDAQTDGVSLFAAGHFETEVPVAEQLYLLLCSEFEGKLTVLRAAEKSPVITMQVSDRS